ncbi:kelch repeat-containing protein [Cystobacter fuscus]|uniref:kelch repeat-containing protein n=1 Tax=Cystobacter fuscus TaxID=43 RepID=UPI0037BEFB45
MTALLLLVACGPDSQAQDSPREENTEGGGLLQSPLSDRGASWTSTASMNRARYYHTASLLSQGKVLVTGGGLTEDSVLDQTELYDPTSATWTPAASLSQPRLGHSATALSNGALLVAGGWDGENYLASAELYDAAKNTWTATAPMQQKRHYHTATRLTDGRVLVVGGWNDSSTLASAELYNPSTGRWSDTGPLSQARDSHAAVLLSDGKVLVMGGWGTTSYLTSAEIYDPNTGKWTLTAPLNFARGYHTATLLANGKVLVAGGYDEVGLSGATQLPRATELYDPDIALWETARPLATARYYHTATELRDGRVFISGGYKADNTATGSAELYEPSSGLWVPAAPMAKTRSNHTATLLTSGQVLVVGGKSGTVLSSAEVYGLDGGSGDPPPETWIDSAPAARTRLTHATFTFHSNEAGATFESSLDGSAFSVSSSPISFQALTEGSHSFQVRAKDATGHVDATPATYQWTVDLTPPKTQLVSAPPVKTRDTTATFSFNSTEGGSTFECKLDGAPFEPCVSPVSLSDLTPGGHSFQVRATDAVGNMDTSPAIHAWSILQQAVVPIIVSPTEGATLSEPTPTLSGTAAPHTPLTLSLDGVVMGSITANDLGEWSFTPSAPLSQGEHVLLVSAHDDAEENVSSSPPRRFTVTGAEPPRVESSGCSVGTGTPCLALVWMLLLIVLPAARRRSPAR